MFFKVITANLLMGALLFGRVEAVETKQKFQLSPALESSFFSYGKSHEAGLVLSKRNLNSMPAFFLLKTSKGKMLDSKLIDAGSYTYLSKELLRIENFLIRKQAFAKNDCGVVVSTSAKDGSIKNFCLDQIDKDSRTKIDEWQKRALVHFL